MGRKIRVLHVLASNQYSGAENVVCQIINMFKDDESIEMVYCSPEGPIREALGNRNMAYVAMRNLSIPELNRVLREVMPTIIHAHDMRASFFVSLVCGKIPFVSHIHNNNFDVRKPTLKAILYLYSAAKAKRIFWVSESSQNGYCFHKLFDNKSTVLYNVIDINSLKKSAEIAVRKDKYDIVFIGRLTEEKNPLRLLEVIHETVRQNPNISAAMIGTGDMEQAVKEELVRRELTGNVHLLGFMSNPYGILKNAKLMLMTSLWEGTPMCALEAMALGVPIVSTPTDGLCELVQPGVTGFLTDDNESMAAFVLKIITDAELRENLATNALCRSSELMNLQDYKRIIYRHYL